MTENQQRFVKQLARFLVERQTAKSVELELEKIRPHVLVHLAQEWADLRATTPLMGYPTVEQAELELAAFLGLAAPERQLEDYSQAQTARPVKPKSQ